MKNKKLTQEEINEIIRQEQNAKAKIREASETKIIKKVKQLSRTQQGVSLTKEDREILNVEVEDLVEVKKHE